MFHSAHIRIPDRHLPRSGLRTFFPSSSFSPPDSGETMRKGILFCSIAIILLLVGCILTWLGSYTDEYNNMFGGKISMTGPLLIALAVLMMLLSCRQFRLAKKRNDTSTSSRSMQVSSRSSSMQMEPMNAGCISGFIIDNEDGLGTTAVILEQEEDPLEADRYEGHRVHGDLAPPSYGDATYLDCSSTCPSFISHDDRNEVPPTYEETCGIFVYGSETSLGPPTPQPYPKLDLSSRSQINSSPNLTSNNPLCSIDMLSPSSALLVNPSTRSGLFNAKGEAKESTRNSSSCSNVSISSEGTVTRLDSTAVSSPEHVREVECLKPVHWSRRSYSSIPSYTCLLSESGEVLSHVFNPTSIISQMNSNMEPPHGASVSESSAHFSTSAPTRSHSASSINRLRQGVPYNLTVTTSSENVKSRLESFASSLHNVDSPTRRRSEGSRPTVGAQIHGLHPKSDSSISNELSTQICRPSISSAQGSFDDGDSYRRNQVTNSPSDALSIPSSLHSHDLLTQDIQETI